MCRVIYLTVRFTGTAEAAGDLLGSAATRIGVELVGVTVSPPRTTAVVAVDDDRCDELLAIDFAANLQVVAGERGVHVAGVRLVEAPAA
jgi:hypothetical protein